MNENIEKLMNEFIRISKKGWISTTSSSHGAVGNLFENELGKRSDALYFPDYYGIEIKCTTRFSKYPLYLFTAAFDGPTFPEIERIVEKYGYYDKDFKDKKVLYERLYFNNKTMISDNCFFQLEMDKVEGKIFLCVYDKNFNLIEKKSFIYIDTLYNHLCLKLNNLAVVKAFKKEKSNIKYFKYYYIAIYKFISFDRFLNLLKNNYIRVELISRISKSGQDRGRYRNKNLVFSIDKKDISKLFIKLKSYNTIFK